jgi:pilus assembly protein Flp/PilA
MCELWLAGSRRPGLRATLAYPAAQEVNLVRRLGRLKPAMEQGQGLAEYALILALIAIVAIVSLIFLGSGITSLLSTVGNSV